ncbi:MAG: (2Fe-2S) ferredoxin domain-containing protein [Bacteroidota bacterium]|nr:(2Fe-2S) ferredoxin domain-containing protein [Bacteroidota bacterium]
MEKKSKTEIVICLGSSCFARGNKNIVNIIKSYIKDNQLEDKIYFHGCHCFDRCSEGPILKINDQIHTEISAQNITNILDSINFSTK